MFDKFKALLAFKKLFTHITENPNDMKLKPGILSSEFWVLLIAQFILVLQTFFGHFDGELAVVLMSILGAAYAFVRNGFKLRSGFTLRPGIQTSELWLLSSIAILELVMAALEKVDGQWATLSATALAALYAVLRKSLKAKELTKS